MNYYPKYKMPTKKNTKKVTCFFYCLEKGITASLGGDFISWEKQLNEDDCFTNNYLYTL
jgi:hypothetical protein